MDSGFNRVYYRFVSEEELVFVSVDWAHVFVCRDDCAPYPKPFVFYDLGKERVGFYSEHRNFNGSRVVH